MLLRKSKLKKAGGAWGWETKSDYEAALKELKALQTAPSKEAPAAKPAKGKGNEAPASAKAPGKKKAA